MERFRAWPLALRLLLFGLVCYALSSCAPNVGTTLSQVAEESAALSGASQGQVATVLASLPTAVPLPPTGLPSAPQGAAQSLASHGAPTAPMEAEMLAVMLAEEATQVLLTTTQSQVAGEVSQAEALAYQMAMQVVLESAEQVLGLPAGTLEAMPISEEQLAVAMQVAQEALPEVLDTLSGLQGGSLTPEQAVQQLQSAAWQFQHAHQTAQQTMTQRQQQGQAYISETQMERLRMRARSQTEQALQTMQQAQQQQTLQQQAQQRAQTSPGAALAGQAAHAQKGANASRGGGK